MSFLLAASRRVAVLLGVAVVASCAGGRVYTSSRLHVGVRPAVACGPEGCTGAGLTVQVTTSEVP